MNNVNNKNYSTSSVRGNGIRTDLPRDSYSPATSEYQRRAMAYGEFMEATKREFQKTSQIIRRSDFTFGMFDRWLSFVPAYHIGFGTKRTGGDNNRRLQYVLRYQLLPGSRDTIIYGVNGTKEQQAYQIIEQVLISARIQMDTQLDSLGGGQSITNDTTTIITAPGEETSNVELGTEIDYICDPSGPTILPIATNKIEHLDTFTIATSNKVGPLKSYKLPQALYKAKSALSLMNNNFVYSRPIMEFQITVLAPVQACGAIIVGTTPDPEGNLDEYSEARTLYNVIRH